LGIFLAENNITIYCYKKCLGALWPIFLQNHMIYLLGRQTKRGVGDELRLFVAQQNVNHSKSTNLDYKPMCGRCPVYQSGLQLKVSLKTPGAYAHAPLRKISRLKMRRFLSHYLKYSLRDAACNECRTTI
jgi:hypothetical protein